MNHTAHKRVGIAIPPSLTKVQKRLFQEINEMAMSVGLDHWNIIAREAAAKERTAQLDLIKRSIARGEVVDEYAAIDDRLAARLCEYFLPRNSVRNGWKKKKFRRFNYYVLERLYLQQKLAFVKDVYEVPKDIVQMIETINALRNAMAHAYIPENLRAYRINAAPRKRVTVRYKGQNIFTPTGIENFKFDCIKVIDFLDYRMKRKKEHTSPGC